MLAIRTRDRQRLLTVAKWGRFMVWRILERGEALVDGQSLSNRLRTLRTDVVVVQAANEARTKANTSARKHGVSAAADSKGEHL